MGPANCVQSGAISSCVGHSIARTIRDTFTVLVHTSAKFLPKQLNSLRALYRMREKHGELCGCMCASACLVAELLIACIRPKSTCKHPAEPDAPFLYTFVIKRTRSTKTVFATLIYCCRARGEKILHNMQNPCFTAERKYAVPLRGKKKKKSAPPRRPRLR